MVDYFLVIMRKLFRYHAMLLLLLSSGLSFAEIGADINTNATSVVPSINIDSGTDEKASAIAELDAVNRAAQAKALETAERVAEAEKVKTEVESVIGHGGRGVVGYRDFFYPQYHGMRLSYCSNDHKVCGSQLASKFCETMGYNRASKVMIDHNVGLTRYLATDLQCQGWKCDGFKLIVCEESLKKEPVPIYYYRLQDFMFPRFENYRVAWCYKDKRGCGKRAADAFCRHQGYRRSKGYERSTEVAATRTVGSGALCFGQACTGFNRITCYR
ncbi:MAG: hypothetical protein K0U37_04495 [Gammaproteobacteria bacterium]|nr:hypothetical protein [Gammaproteobacteria bacterium]